MTFWEKVNKDLQKGFKEGVHALKESAAFVRVKAEELTDEGKKRYKIYELKAAVQKEFTALGGKIYELSLKVDNPLKDAAVRNTLAKIKKLEAQITRLEAKPKAPAKKRAAKRPAKRVKKAPPAAK